MKNRRPLAAVLLTGLVALVAAGPVFAEEPSVCTCDILAACKWFTLAWQDTCPPVARGEIERALGQDEKRKLLERLAHGVAFASQAWHLVRNNPDLQAKLDASPISLVHVRSGRVQMEEALQSVGSNFIQTDVDSVLPRFQRVDKISVAKLYTVRLGSYGSEQAAKTGATHWRFLNPESLDASPALEDSLLSVTWKYSSCAGERSPAVFLLPPSLSSSGRYDLDFRLVIDKDDAQRLARLIQQRSLARVEVVAVSVDWGVLATVLAQ